MKLHDRLRELRTSRKFTLKDLAERSGLSVSYLSDIERGRTVPTINSLEAMASAFGISVVDFLIGTDFAGVKTEASLPDGLKALLEDPNYGKEINDEWIETLSKIQLRGKRPQSKDEWLELYLHLRRILE